MLSGKIRLMPSVHIRAGAYHVEFELAGAPGARRWFDYARAVVNSGTNTYWLTPVWEENATKPEEYSLERVQVLCDELRSYTHRLRNTGYDFAECNAAIDRLAVAPTQADCNITHRTFTTLVMDGWSTGEPEIERAIHGINGATHRLEVSFPQQRREQFNGRVFQVLFTDADTRNNVDFSIWNTRLDGDFYDHRAHSTDYDVWMNDDILGKDLPRCFLDADDPHERDITGNRFLTPSLYFDLDRHYHHVAQSTEFNQWLDTTGCTKTLDRWPLGTITHISKLPDVQIPVMEFEFND